MFRIIEGSIFDSTCDFLTNTVNTQGAMGAGLALEFRLRIPEMYTSYRELCGRGEIKIGSYWIYARPNRTQKKVVNFPVKKEFAKPSRFEYIIQGLDYFLENFEKDEITSIAMPTLGSRLGKLDDGAVLELMEEDLSELPIRIEVYRRYGQDRLTKLMKKQIEIMSSQELRSELPLGLMDAEHLKTKVQRCFLLSDLIAFEKINLEIIQKIYDLAFQKLLEKELSNF
jgi:O-acetyl-ADP-ribose deacetylase (regulator of RNase III)